MQAAVEFLGVEWIGDKKPVLEQIGTLVAATVAAYAAWLAARTANRHQKEQLKAAERELELKLDHDVLLKDRDVLRTITTELMTSCLGALREVNELLLRARRRSNLLARAEAKTKQALDADSAENRNRLQVEADKLHRQRLDSVMSWEEEREAVYETLKVLTYDNVRIRVLVGPEDTLTVTHKEFANELRRSLKRLSSAAERPLPIKVNEAVEELPVALGRFEEAVLKEFSKRTSPKRSKQPSRESKRGLLDRVAGRASKREVV